MALTLEGLEKWYIQTVKLKYAFAGADAPDPIPMPDVTDIDGLLENIVTESEGAAWNAAKKMNKLTYVTSSSYSVVVPLNAKYNRAALVVVGGKTVQVNDDLSHSVVSKIVSKDADGQEIETITIPSDIKSLTGYGWSAGEAYNYIDFKNKKFVQNVGRVDMGTMTWTISNSHFYSLSISNLVKPNTSKDIPGNIIMPVYITESFNTLTSYTVDKCCSLGRATGAQTYIQIYDTSKTLEELQTYLNGKYLYYELNTPVETDISAYIDGNDIAVAPDGTITFTNQYQRAVPSEVGYYE